MSSLYDSKKLSKEEHDFLLQFLEFNLYDLEYYNTEKNTNSLREKFEALYQSAFNDLNLFISNEVEHPLQIIIVHSHIRLLNTTDFRGKNYIKATKKLNSQVKPEQEIIIPHPDIDGYLSLKDGCGNILARQSWKGIYETALKQAGLWLTYTQSGFEQSSLKFNEDFKAKWISSMKFLNNKVGSFIKEKDIEEMIEPKTLHLNAEKTVSFLFPFHTNLEKKIYETGFTFKEFFPVKFNRAHND